MDYKIVWSDRSLSNLREIVEFIAHENPFAADKIGQAILKKTDILVQFPKAGRVFSGLDRDDVREIPQPPYRIIYQIVETEKRISILTVWHGARSEPVL